MNTKIRLFVVFAMLLVSLAAFTATASASAEYEVAVPTVLNSAPHVPSLENQCGKYEDIAGRQICIIPLYGGTASFDGDTITFTHSRSYMGEAAMALIVRQDYSWSGSNALHVSDDAFDILMYTDLNNASTDAYRAGSTVLTPYDQVSILYIGAQNAEGETFNVTVGDLSQFAGTPVIDAGQY